MSNFHKIQKIDKQTELNLLRDATELISFDTRITNIRHPSDILNETTKKILSIYEFLGISFYLINEEDGSFYQAFCFPEGKRDKFEIEYLELVETGLLSHCLINNSPQFSLTTDGDNFLLIHPIATTRRVRGIFIGICDQSRDKFPEHVLYMLTLIFFSCANLIESYETYAYVNKLNQELKQYIEELESLNKRLTNEISIRQERELELKRSEEKYRSIIENIDDAYVEVDINGIIKFCNESLLKITGYKKQEIIEEHFSRLTDKEQTKSILKDIKDLFSKKHVGKYYNWKFYKKNGKIIWVESLISTIRDKQGNTIGFRTILRDITQRIEYEKRLRESEKRYKTIFENTGTPTIIVGEKGTILMTNHETEKLFGYKKSEIEGKMSIKDFIYPEDFEDAWKFHKEKRVLGKQSSKKMRCRAVDIQGNIRQLIITSELIPGTKDSVVSILDLTEQDELESQLRQARKFEALGTLAGGIAHEFNNILQGIKSNIELILLKYKDRLNEESLFLKTQDLIYRAGVIVNRLLTFSRKTDIKMEEVDLNKVIKEANELLRGGIRKRIDIKVNYHSSPVLVLGDRIQLEEIILNLVNNAADAIGKTKQGIIEIGVVPKKRSDLPEILDLQGTHFAHLWVKDNGCGIEKDKIDKIFTPFYTTKEPSKGTGLGLSIVYGIVKSHKGYITCESEPGVGTGFNVFLPIVGLRQKDEKEEQRDQIQDQEEIGGSVLVVDDEEVIRDVVKDALSMKGLKVSTASSSEEALMYLREGKKFDLVLMDLDMPGMGGVQGVKALLGECPDLKIIISSGYGREILTQDPEEIGAIDFLKKPFSLDKLFEVVLKYIKG